MHPALNNIDPNIYGSRHPQGYGGMSAGMKVGRPDNGLINRNGYAGGRPNGVGGSSIR